MSDHDSYSDCVRGSIRKWNSDTGLVAAFGRILERKDSKQKRRRTQRRGEHLGEILHDIG